jgi:hypothetical protein
VDAVLGRAGRARSRAPLPGARRCEAERDQPGEAHAAAAARDVAPGAGALHVPERRAHVPAPRSQLQPTPADEGARVTWEDLAIIVGIVVACALLATWLDRGRS